MTETGPVSYECPKQPGLLHVIESGCYAEVIGPDGRPAAAGETGELVLTTLNRTAAPLLRYRTGDLVRLGPACQCACGRHEIALDGGILGRVDDMVIVRGVNVFPSAVEDVLRRFPEVAEFQAQVDKSPTLTELSLRIEPLPGSGDVAGLLQRISAEIQVSLSLRVPLTAAAPGSLPRFEMKAKRWTVKTG